MIGWMATQWRRLLFDLAWPGAAVVAVAVAVAAAAAAAAAVAVAGRHAMHHARVEAPCSAG